MVSLHLQNGRLILKVIKTLIVAIISMMFFGNLSHAHLGDISAKIPTYTYKRDLLDSPKRWTYIFFINGDFDYLGPTRHEGSSQITIQDQSRRVYKSIHKLATTDKTNNYVIFWDPRGKGQFFNSKYVRMKIYKRGEFVSSKIGLSEVNAGDKKVFETLREKIDEGLGIEYARTKKMLYFYGEHFPLRGAVQYDLSHKSDGFGYLEFRKGLDILTKGTGGFELIFMHTCYVNTLSFLNTLTDYTKEFIVPKKAILNGPLDLSTLTSEFMTTQGRVSGLLNSNRRHSDYELINYNSFEINILSRHLEEVSYDMDLMGYNSNYFSMNFNRDAKRIQQFAPSLIALPLTREVLVPITAFINLMDMYLIRGEFNLIELDIFLNNNAHLTDLYEVMMPL